MSDPGSYEAPSDVVFRNGRPSRPNNEEIERKLREEQLAFRKAKSEERKLREEGWKTPWEWVQQGKQYPNTTENEFARMMDGMGWRVTKRGWPDFMAVNPENGEAIVVEVKPPGQQLSDHQWNTMRFLSRHGVKCFVSDGTALVPFDPENPPSSMEDPYYTW